MKPRPEITIVCDTREQRRLVFRNAPMIVATLKTGDYSAIGYEDKVSVERKSLSDLLGCIGHGRDRFERELCRLSRIRYRALVIEGDLRPLLQGLEPRLRQFDSQQWALRQSRIHPSAVLGSLVTWSLRYSLPVWFCSDPDHCAQVTERIILKAVQELNEARPPQANIAVDVYRCPPISTLATEGDCMEAANQAAACVAGLPDFVPLQDFARYLTQVHQRGEKLRAAGCAEPEGDPA